MLAVAFALGAALAAAPESARVLSKLAECRVPHVLLPQLRDGCTPGDVAARFGLPANCVWYVIDGWTEDAKAALESGMHVIWIRPGHRSEPDKPSGRFYRVADISDVLDVLSGPYTRSALALRSLLLSCDGLE